MLYSAQCLKSLCDMLRQQLAIWQLSEETQLSVLNISENATFLAQNHDTKYIFRVYRPEYHQDDEIYSELMWMQALKNDNIVRVPHIYPTKDNALFIHSQSDGYNWRIVCFEYLDGYEPIIDNELFQRFEELGTIAAYMHIHSQNWKKPKNFRRKHWNYKTMASSEAYWGDWRKERLSREEKQLFKKCDLLIQDKEQKLEINNNTYLLLHADLRLTNLVIYNDKIAVLDFDDCGYSWKALDFANAVSFIEDNPIVPDLQEAWIYGYNRIKPLDAQVKKTIPLFIMMRRLQLMAWIKSHEEVPAAQAMQASFLTGTLQLAEKFLINQTKKY